MCFISSKENARRVSERTLPREPTLKDSAVALSSSGASQTATTSWLPSVPIEVLDGNAALLGHFLEGFRAADRLFNVADALIGEACKHGPWHAPPRPPHPTGIANAYNAFASFSPVRIKCRNRGRTRKGAGEA